ncbi:MAG: hypothetical protein HY907_05860, partial [Deltaproteobacteria bacterium]|nr:hypothetical protein [Deltaproteobacteria bacterium]
EPAAPPAPVHTAAVCAGSGHTCYLKASGEVLCTGDNIDGQLGDGTATNRGLPTPVADLAGVMEIACGVNHTCARREDGTVMCWGQSWHGELGCGSKDPTQTPVAVKDLAGAKQLALGYAFSCALRDDGKVACWGLGSEGQLGREARESSDVPVEIAGLDGVAELAAGYAHVCARKASGEVLCWGQSDERLGRGETAGAGWSPMPVANLTGAKMIGAGNDHTCALTDAGLSCWGGNYAGELGNGQKGYDQSSKVPVAVADVGAGVQQLALRGDHSCVRLESGEVKCWGDFGRLGVKLVDVADDASDVQKAGALREMSDAAFLAVGEYHGCIIRKSGQLVCFGNGNYGVASRDYEAAYQVVAPDIEKLVGEAPVRYTFAPSAEATLRPVPHLSAGHEFVCGVRESGKIYCFGGGGTGELGCGSSQYRGSGQGCEVGGISDGVQVSATLTQACALRANGQVVCWGGLGGITTGLPMPIGGIANATKIDIGGTAGSTEGCAILADKTVACWASYQNAGLLAGQTYEPLTGMVIPGVTDAEQIAVGYDTACYINTAGKVLCWGDAYHGALGRDTEEDAPAPVEVPRLSRATHIAGNGYNFCVVHSGGKLTCWGMNDEGQIGNGKMDPEKPVVATEVRGVRGAVASVVGSGTTCALLESGEAMCWGSNPWNECGINDSESDAILKPSQVLRTQDPTVGAWGPFAGLATGLRFGCAVHADGNVSCWGDTPITASDSILGIGSTRSGFPVPAPGITFPPPATELVPAT